MSEYLVRSRALIHIDEVMQELGGDSSEIIGAVGLTDAHLVSQDHYINAAKYIQLIEDCSERFECKDFGLKLAQKQSFDVLGPLGLLLKHSQNIYQALNATRSFMAFHSQMEYWDFVEEGSEFVVFRTDYFHGILNARQYKELAIGVSFRIAEKLLGDTKEVLRIEFSHAPVSPESTYQRFFKKPVCFNCERDAVVYRSSVVDTKLNNTNPAVLSHVARYLELLNIEYQHDLPTLVKILIQQSLSSGECNIRQVANLLNTSKRTLQRRLDESNLNFKQILLETRMSLARWYLGASQMSITQIASALGYCDVGNFSRAFYRSHLKSPRLWQKEYKNS